MLGCTAYDIVARMRNVKLAAVFEACEWKQTYPIHTTLDC